MTAHSHLAQFVQARAAELVAGTLALPYPQIDPTAFEIAGFKVQWYALAYITGVLAGWFIAVRLSKGKYAAFSTDNAHDFPAWVLLGVVLGGRLGYVIFYKPRYYFEYPSEIIAVWQGGMSFHGGLLGVLAASWLFAQLRRVPVMALADLVSLSAPIGLFLGRLANFVNGELWGRTTEHWIGMVFPTGGPLPRHPSQLYEALTEGVLLLAALWLVRARTLGRVGHGYLTGAFLVGYGLARSLCEFFREPDGHLGFILGPFTMGQLLCVPMIVGGALVMRWAAHQPPPTARTEAAAG